MCLYRPIYLVSSQIREEIEYENLAKMYLAELIKKECWDDMDTKGRGLCVGQLIVNTVTPKSHSTLLVNKTSPK